MKRIIGIICLTAILFTILALSAGATDIGQNEAVNEHTEGDGESNEYGMHNSEGTEESENIFEDTYALIRANSDKLLSALAFIGSLILALAYKKGLLPTVNTAISSLASVVGGIKDAAEKCGTASNDIKETLTDKLGLTEKSLCGIAERLTALENSLSEINEEGKRGELIEKTLRAELDMLYEIFIASSLPEYQKEEIRGKMKTIRAGLSGGTPNE